LRAGDGRQLLHDSASENRGHHGHQHQFANQPVVRDVASACDEFVGEAPAWASLNGTNFNDSQRVNDRGIGNGIEAKVAATPSDAMATPASAGPTDRDKLYRIELVAMTWDRRPGGATSFTSERRTDALSPHAERGNGVSQRVQRIVAIAEDPETRGDRSQRVISGA
jgi:hypothetical protein